LTISAAAAIAVTPVAAVASGAGRGRSIAHVRRRIACTSIRTIRVRATFDALIDSGDVFTMGRVSSARRTRWTTHLVRIAWSAQRRIVAIIPGVAAIVSRLIHERPIALSTNVQIGKRWVSAERLEKRRRWKQGKPGIAQFDDRRLIGRPLEIRKYADEVRHLEVEVARDAVADLHHPPESVKSGQPAIVPLRARLKIERP